MARIVVVGSVAQDDVVTLRQPLSAGWHLDAAGRRLRRGGGGANTAIALRHARHHVSLVAPVGGDAVAGGLLGKQQAVGGRGGARLRVHELHWSDADIKALFLTQWCEYWSGVGPV